MSIKYRRDLWMIVPTMGGAAEIGVAEGYFSADLLRMPCNFPVVYMVDRWLSVPTQKGDASHPQSWHDKNLADAQKRVAGFGERAVFLRGDSRIMANAVPNLSLALVYIDGDHSFEGCMADIHAWLPKVMPGGVMAFHDYQNMSYGVNRAVNSFASSTNKQIFDIPEDRPADAGAWIRL